MSIKPLPHFLTKVCTISQRECGDNIDQQNFAFTFMIGHLDTNEFHKNENDYLHKTDRERMESVAAIAHENMLKTISEKTKQQLPLFERITRDVSVEHKDEVFGKVAAMHIAKQAANDEAAANCLAMASQKGLYNKWPDTRYCVYSEPRQNETYAWDPRDLTYNYAVVYGISTDDRSGKCGTFGAFTTKDHYYEERRWWFWDKTVRSNTDWYQRSADFAACKYVVNSGHIRSTYFDASMFFDMVVRNVFITVINPVMGFSGMVTDIIFDFASLHMDADNFRVFKLFVDTSRNLLCGLADGLDPKQFLLETSFDGIGLMLETSFDGIGLIDPGLEAFGQACKGFSGAAFALKAGESTIKAIKCVGTGFGNAVGCPEIGLVTGVACGFADYKATGNSKALIHAADNISATLLGTPSGMIVVGDMAVTAIRAEINHHDFRRQASGSHGIGEGETRVFALPEYDDNLIEIEECCINDIEQSHSQWQQTCIQQKADVFVDATQNEESGSKDFNAGGELDYWIWNGKGGNDWILKYVGQNEDKQMPSTSDDSGRNAAHLIIDGFSDANMRFHFTEFKNRYSNNMSLGIYDSWDKQWVLRCDGPHRNAPEPHINVNPKYTAKPDPHTPITDSQLKMSKKLAKGVKSANVILHGTSVLLDANQIYEDCFSKEGRGVKKCLSTTSSIVFSRFASIVAASKATLLCMEMGGHPALCVGVVAPCFAVGAESLVENVVKKVSDNLFENAIKKETNPHQQEKK